MNDISISDMMKMQRELWEVHRDKWSPIEPAYGSTFILYMIEEIGECISVIKKKGDTAIVEDADIRAHFAEEMSDVLMYYIDTLLRYGFSPDEISSAFIKKHCANMSRDYDSEYKNLNF